MSCITLLISSFCMAYMMSTIQKYVPHKVWSMAMIFVCVYPLFGTYSYTSCKDNLFADGLLLFYAFVLDIVFQDGIPLQGKTFRRNLAAVIVVIPFLKNQGLLVVVTSLFVVALCYKKARKYIALDIALSIFIYSILFSHVLMPLLKIAPGGKQEALSVPFQQTALYVKEYEEELTQDERDAIDAVLPIDDIAHLYVPEQADAVKFQYRQQATTKELSQYFTVWFKQFWKHPNVYIKAFFALNDGYYYLDFDDANLNLDACLDMFGAVSPQWVQDFTAKENEFWLQITEIPIIGCFFRAAVFSWVMIITVFYCIYSKRYRCLIVLTPVLLNFAVCILSPWSGIIRYALPVIYAIPMHLCILFGKEADCEE